LKGSNNKTGNVRIT